MRITALFGALAVVVIGLWFEGMRQFDAEGRRADAYFFWDGASVEIVSGMAIIGLLAAVVVGGLIGLAWPWRAIGLASTVPFAALVAVFALLSSSDGSCPDVGGPCAVSAFVRFGGLLVTLGCCAVAAFVAQIVRNGAPRRR